MTVAGHENGNGPLLTKSIQLNATEIGQIVDALSVSHFWQLPEDPQHIGGTDGEVAGVEVSVAGWKHHVADVISSDAVDLSILVNALGDTMAQHQINMPGRAYR